MNLTTGKIIVRSVLVTYAVIGTFGFTLIARAAPAGAPQMVANELAAQRALGYEPCEPKLGQIPADQNPDGAIYAWAGGTMPGETCEVSFSTDMPVEAMEWVAWHEVCHLSTLNRIFADPHRPIVDAAHRHPEFLACISHGPVETGGYLH